jgi:hypothetical protein
VAFTSRNSLKPLTKRRILVKLVSLGVAALVGVGSFGTAFAQSKTFAPDPQTCVSNVSALDVNADTFVDNREMAQYGRIETNVDTDGDGRISSNEVTVACRDGALDALEPEGG